MSKNTVKSVINMFYKWAPPQLAASWDNVGLQIGDPSAEFSEICIALEVDETVLAFLEGKEGVCVITHHPLFFRGLKRLRYDQDMGQILTAFCKGQHHLYSAHTNLDAAEGGVNDILIEQYGLDPKKGTVIEDGFGKFFDKPKLSYEALCNQVASTTQGAVYDGPVKRLAFGCGSGHGLISRVIDLGVDTFVTGEVTYHDHVTCRMNGVRLITLGHKESEDFICTRIKQRCEETFAETHITVL